MTTVHCNSYACLPPLQARGENGEPAPKKKKQKTDKQGRGSGRPQRPTRQRPGPEEVAERQQPAAAVAADLPEVNENEILETDADRAFIDDEGE